MGNGTPALHAIPHREQKARIEFGYPDQAFSNLTGKTRGVIFFLVFSFLSFFKKRGPKKGIAVRSLINVGASGSNAFFIFKLKTSGNSFL